MTAHKHDRKRRPSGAVRSQAQRVYKHTVFTQILAEDLIGRFARRVENEYVRGVLLLDFRIIAKALAIGDPETKSDPKDPPKRAMWERYAHQFQTQQTRRNFSS